MAVAMGHEKLRVYQRGLAYTSWTHSVLAGIDQSVAALDHWDRAADSIVENIANGNSRHSRADRNQYFDVAIGSALECAACLDICDCKKLITAEQKAEGKTGLQRIVNMTIGLREAQSAYVREDREEYIVGKNDGIYFAHERLDVYHRLDLCPDHRRSRSLSRSSSLPARSLAGSLSISIAVSIVVLIVVDLRPHPCQPTLPETAIAAANASVFALAGTDRVFSFYRTDERGVES